jgi:hypothetical protein
MNITQQKEDKMSKLKLNAEKRKVIADIFQSHFEKQPSKERLAFESAKENYNNIMEETFTLAKQEVRRHQPQEDVDTIKAMVNKYSRSGGEWNEDCCFDFTVPKTVVHENGTEEHTKERLNVSFGLDRNFANAYYYDELKSKGFNPNYEYQWGESKNPTYYEEERKVEDYLGFSRRSENSNYTHDYNKQWKERCNIDVIGSNYCHSREFQVDETTMESFRMYDVIKDKVAKTHEAFYHYINNKMTHLKLGLKSYTKFDEAKELADNLGVVLDENMLNATTGTSLSIYSPSNLADMLKDNEEDNAKELIKQAFLQAKMQRESVN